MKKQEYTEIFSKVYAFLKKQSGFKEPETFYNLCIIKGLINNLHISTHEYTKGLNLFGVYCRFDEKINGLTSKTNSKYNFYLESTADFEAFKDHIKRAIEAIN